MEIVTLLKKGRCLNQSHLICTSQGEHTNPTDDPSRARDHVVGHGFGHCLFAERPSSKYNSFSSHILPGYKGSAFPNFHWGQHDATTTINWLDKIYTEVVHWRYSLFSVPMGSKFVMELSRLYNALSCRKGGYPSIRHNEIRNLTAKVLTEVCNDVLLEPPLQPLTGERFPGASVNTSEGAHLDISFDGFWGGKFEKTFVDIRVFNPHAPGGMAGECNMFYKRLAHVGREKAVKVQ